MSIPPKISMTAARVNARLSQREAAKALNITPATLRNWESGITMPSVAKAAEMAMLYNYPIEYIFFGK